MCVGGGGGDGRSFFSNISSRFTEDFEACAYLIFFLFYIKPSQLRLTIYQCIAVVFFSYEEKKHYITYFGWI